MSSFDSDVKSSVYGWTEKIDLAQKLLSLLNFYTPKEIRKYCLGKVLCIFFPVSLAKKVKCYAFHFSEVLHTIILIYQDDCVSSLIPIIYQSHRSRKENPDPGTFIIYIHPVIYIKSVAICIQ
jgi:hypothetical protein